MQRDDVIDALAGAVTAPGRGASRLRTLPETPERDRRNLRMEIVYAGRRSTMALTPAQALARIRQICLALPEATEKEAWGRPTFRVRDRLFVMFVNDHHGDGRLAIWCNAGPGAQAAIVEADAKRFFVPPYVGKGGWIGIRLDRRPNWAVVAALVEEGYRTAAARAREEADVRRHRGTEDTETQR